MGLASVALAQQNLPLNPEPASPSTPPSLDLTFPEPASPPPADLLQRILGEPAAIPFDEYRLGPGDGIFVAVQRFPDLSFQATLDIQGNVIVPIAGAVNLSGMTLETAQETLYAIYNQYVIEPDVTLTLTTQRPVEVTVLGEVTRPGFYPLPAPQVTTALLSAGGSTVNADLRSIRIQRTLANGEELETTVDLFTPLKEGTALPNVRLQHGDVVIVPTLDPDSLDGYDRTLVGTSTLAKPQIAVRVLNYASGPRGIEARFGTLVLPNGSRFLDALSQANINPDYAVYNGIAVLRFNPDKGAADTFVIDAGAAINGDITQNIPMQDSDVIIVDRNLLAQVTYSLNAFTQPFRDVLGFLLFFESLSDAADSLFGPGD